MLLAELADGVLLFGLFLDEVVLVDDESGGGRVAIRRPLFGLHSGEFKIINNNLFFTQQIISTSSPFYLYFIIILYSSIHFPFTIQSLTRALIASIQPFPTLHYPRPSFIRNPRKPSITYSYPLTYLPHSSLYPSSSSTSVDSSMHSPKYWSYSSSSSDRYSSV